MKIGYNPKDVEEAQRAIFWLLSDSSVKKFNKGGFLLSLLHAF